MKRLISTLSSCSPSPPGALTPRCVRQAQQPAGDDGLADPATPRLRRRLVGLRHERRPGEPAGAADAGVRGDGTRAQEPGGRDGRGATRPRCADAAAAERRLTDRAGSERGAGRRRRWWRCGVVVALLTTMLPSRSSNTLHAPPAASGPDAVMCTPYWPGSAYVWLNVWLCPGPRLTSASSGPSPHRSFTSRRVERGAGGDRVLHRLADACAASRPRAAGTRGRDPSPGRAPRRARAAWRRAAGRPRADRATGHRRAARRGLTAAAPRPVPGR